METRLLKKLAGCNALAKSAYFDNIINSDKNKELITVGTEDDTPDKYYKLKILTKILFL